MAHYAFMDNENKVVEVIVGVDEGQKIAGLEPEDFYSKTKGKSCKRTSYNTSGGENKNDTPFRKNFAGIGFSYDPDRDAFIPPKPYPSWKINETSCLWEAPVAMPTDGKMYNWDEDSRVLKEATAV